MVGRHWIKLQRASEQEITAKDHPIFIALQDVFTRYPNQTFRF